MVEIKYRVYSKELGHMIDWEEILNSPALKDYLTLGKGDDYHSELMAFTGLRDKNNVDIYEGDIIQSGKRIFVVKHFPNICTFNCFSLDDENSYPAMVSGTMKYCIVVGNIYENIEYTGKLF